MNNKLTNANVNKEYPQLGKLKRYRNLGGKALLQENYGKELDCTITSLTFLYGEQNYNLIESIATKFGYNGDKYGTYPVTICAIMKRVMKELGIKGTPHHAYGKQIQFTYKTIKDLIDKKHYILLNLWKDGRDYYTNHTVTIIGYAEYENAKFIIVYDNWNTTPCYIDYDKLHRICSLNWYL